MKKMEGYIQNMKKFKNFVKDFKKEDAPANAVGTGVNVSLPPAVEPGILPKKKKKKGVVMGMISRKIQENDDNNNIILKQILDGIDKVDVAIDTQHQKKENIEFIEAKCKKSFKEKYHINNVRKKNI